LQLNVSYFGGFAIKLSINALTISSGRYWLELENMPVKNHDFLPNRASICKKSHDSVDRDRSEKKTLSQISQILPKSVRI